MAEGAYEWGGKSGVGPSAAGDDPLGSMWGTQAGRGPASRGLNFVLYKSGFTNHRSESGENVEGLRADTRLRLDALRCPSDRGYQGLHSSRWRESKLSSYDHYGNSYAVSTLWLGPGGSGCKLLSNAAHLRAISRVPNPANTQYYLENCGRFAWAADVPGKSDGCPSVIRTGCFGKGLPQEASGWHGRAWQFQVGFVDGHASAHRMRGRQRPAPRLSHYPAWRGNATSHSFWRCAIVRDGGWQIDTLPATPAETDASCFESGVVTVPL